MATKYAAIRGMYAQIFADKLREPKGGLFIIHVGASSAFVTGRFEVRKVPAVPFCSHLGDDVLEAVQKWRGVAPSWLMVQC